MSWGLPVAGGDEGRVLRKETLLNPVRSERKQR